MIVGVGLDLVEIARVEELLRWKGERALRRLFTFREVDYSQAHVFPARNFAARLAAKEAAFKALSGTPLARAIAWREIEVVGTVGGQPELEFHGKARRRAEELGVTKSWVTLSHTDTMAVAVVVLERSDGNANPQQ